MVKHLNRKAQSTVEYILLVTAVIAVVIIFLLGDKSVFQKRLTNTIDTATSGMEHAANRLIP